MDLDDKRSEGVRSQNIAENDGIRRLENRQLILHSDAMPSGASAPAVAAWAHACAALTSTAVVALRCAKV
jgi:hypothetical protein